MILNTQMPPVKQIQILIRTVHTVVKTITNLGIRNTLVSIAGKFVIWTCPIRVGYTTCWKKSKKSENLCLKNINWKNNNLPISSWPSRQSTWRSQSCSKLTHSPDCSHKNLSSEQVGVQLGLLFSLSSLRCSVTSKNG